MKPIKQFSMYYKNIKGHEKSMITAFMLASITIAAIILEEVTMRVLTVICYEDIFDNFESWRDLLYTFNTFMLSEYLVAIVALVIMVINYFKLAKDK